MAATEQAQAFWRAPSVALPCSNGAGSRDALYRAPMPLFLKSYFNFSTLRLAGLEGQAEGAFEPESRRQEGVCRLEGGVRSAQELARKAFGCCGCIKSKTHRMGCALGNNFARVSDEYKACWFLLLPGY